MIEWEVFDLGSDLNSIRDKFTSLKFQEGINILSLQPGVGKKYKIKEYLKENENWLVTVPNYTLIESECQDLIKLEGVTYWQGFERKCPKILENNSYIKTLYQKTKPLSNSNLQRSMQV